MADPLVIGAGIGAASDLLGGMIGASTGNQAANKAWKRQKYLLKTQLQMRVKDAEKAGIHPLAAIGSQPVNFQPIPIGRTDYGIGRAGQTISRAMQQLPTQAEKQLQTIQLEQEKEKLKQMQLQSQAMVKAQMPQPAIDTHPLGIQGQSDGPQFVTPQVPLSDSAGVKMGVLPLERWYIDKNKRMKILPTQEASEPMESSTVDNLGYGVDKLMQQARDTINWMRGNDPKIRPPKKYLLPGHKYVHDGYTWKQVPVKQKNKRKTRQQRRYEGVRKFFNRKPKRHKVRSGDFGGPF